MPSPRVCVLRAPGTNCDIETAYAFEIAGAKAERVHLFRLLENPATLDPFQVVCIPGGFSYGDDLGAGVIFASQLRGRLVDAVGRFLRADKLVLGICNGFQVLLKAGILPGGCDAWPPQPDRPPQATLTWNINGKYTALWVRLRVASSTNVFLHGITTLELPIAHAEGRIAVRSSEVIESWRERGQIALCYHPHEMRPSQSVSTIAAAAAAGVGTELDSGALLGAASAISTVSSSDVPFSYPDNPNGSIANIAGLSDPTGRILGLMPHPERYLDATQHPQWTRRPARGEGEGLAIFRNAVAYFG